MKYSYAVLALSLGTIGYSTPIHQSSEAPRPKPVCKDIVLPIQAAANNTVFPLYPNSTAPGVVYEYLGSFNASTLPVAPVSGTFNISAIYCEPSVVVKGREGTIQFLLHGLTSSKEYWTNGVGFPHPTFRGEYSWVYHAASQGYATLAIDNLGNGHSSRPDPVKVVQGSLQLSVIHNIISGLRLGTLPNVPKYNKVVMAAHSYGSVLARLVATFFPTDGADAYILTAAAAVLTGLPNLIPNFEAQAASAVDSRFPNLAPAYLSAKPSSIRDILYGLEGEFDPEMLAWDEKIPHIFAVGEIAAFPPALPAAFTGPVMVLTGRLDQIACGKANITAEVADCGIGPNSHLAQMSSIFPKASRFDAYTTDDTAHNINTHYSAPESFGAAHQWLQDVGM